MVVENNQDIQKTVVVQAARVLNQLMQGYLVFFFFQAEDGIRDLTVTGRRVLFRSDVQRRGAHPATDELLQLLFRARDALERAVELSVVGRERELDVAAIVADLEQAAVRMAPARPGERERPAPLPAPPPAEPEPEAAGRLVQVTLRPEAPLKG